MAHRTVPLLLALLAAPLGAQAPTVSASELSDDLALLERTLRSVHPGLTLHRPEAEIDAAFADLSRAASGLADRYGDAIPVTEAYLPVAALLSAIRDGHTQLNPYNQTGSTRAALFDRADRVPFAFRLLGDRMVVTGDATPDRSLPPGTEVIALDGRLVPEVIAALLPYVRADGGNDGKRRALLQIAGTAPAEDFDILYPLVFETSGDLSLTVRRPDGTEAEIHVARTTRDARLARLADRDPDLPLTNDDELDVRVLDDGTGLVRIGTFATFNMETDYGAWLVNAFRQVSGAPRLIVDLRGNEGGWTDAALLLFRHLLTEPVEISLWGSVLAYDVFPEALRPHVMSWDDGYLDRSAVAVRLGDGTFRLQEPTTLPVPPAPDAYPGPAAVIMDADASSATFRLAMAIRETGAAVLVGQETGGSLHGLNAGSTVFLTLPHTGFVVDIPLIGSRPAAPGPDRGVIPDVLVAPDPDAVIAGRDPEVEAALTALRANRP